MEKERTEIVIAVGSLLADIQLFFCTCYPFLMIEFLQRNKSMSTYRLMRTKHVTQLQALPGDKTAVAISIEKHRTVAAVIKEIHVETGVIVRISRKSGKVWSPISLTDEWTLERQNAAGEYISELMKDHEPK